MDNYETEKTVWELYGRTGFEALGVNYIDEQYADGSIETVAVTIPARDVTVNLIVHGKTRLQRNEVLHGIVNQIFEYGARTSWGKLKVELADETVVYLNCFYSGGLESQAETDPLTHLLSLSRPSWARGLKLGPDSPASDAIIRSGYDLALYGGEAATVTVEYRDIEADHGRKDP